VSFLGVEGVRDVKVVLGWEFGVFEGLFGEGGEGWREEVAGGFGREWRKFPALPCSVFFFRFVIYAGESGIPALPCPVVYNCGKVSEWNVFGIR
jgi:hypothetical protein